MNDQIAHNLQEVTRKIEDAALKAGRNPGDVTLIAVSKTKPVSMLLEAYEQGCRDFGENKVQEILEKYDRMPADTRFHMIGPLQRNKVKYILDKVALIHSVDSVRLAQEISKEAVKRNLETDILIEVNVAEEETKFGTRPEDTISLIREIAQLPAVHIKGLMTIAPYVEKSEENRKYFEKLRQLAVDIREQNIDNVKVEVLSMGMTGDYEVAVEEGATYVRVGTGIFGGRS